ncbi:tRNA pseudouridine(55) synthase TruB [Niveibacterium sp. SC-1]|uniref:tRNA pseudouridine(55) synthase TruB n=1 Tax=Niveibacterium sp. SC-1 TaxID=3135646 RepID=UPI00312054B0
MSARIERPPRQRVDGVVLLDKPSGLSSNTALQKVRRLYNAAKGGHTGTLDPLASGLLPLCLGEATKFSQMLLDADKAYVARVRLGETTDTGDAEGEILQSRPVSVDLAQIQAALPGFSGEITQIPPMYSALKRDGKPLYEYARAGVTLERAPRQVRVHELSADNFDGRDFDLSVACSKGTYIRTLAEDIGEALGCGAHLVALRRTRIGGFHIDAAVSLAALDDPHARAAALAPADLLAGGLPIVELDAVLAGAFTHGQAVRPQAAGEGLARVFAAGAFLGLGRREADGRLLPHRLVAFTSGA